MGRRAGQQVKCTCTKCGAVEMRGGCTAGFQCVTCNPAQRRDSLNYQAHKAVAAAIRSGVLAHPSTFACADCGKPASQYDHRDYLKPLDVAPVCRPCNHKRGAAFNSVWRPSASFND